MDGTRNLPPAESAASVADAGLLPICVLAGGLGTRLGQLGRTAPKALVTVADEPFAFHQLRLLADNGASSVIFCVGHLGDLIEETIGPSRFGLRISYSHDSPSLDGTLGAIRRALPLLGDRFLVLYGDTYLPIDYKDVQRSWLSSGLPAVMTILRNDNRWGASNAVLQGERVVAHDKAAVTPDMCWIDYGLGGLSSDLVKTAPIGESDLSGLYSDLAQRDLLYGYEVTERFHEIGTPEALAETSGYLASRRYR